MPDWKMSPMITDINLGNIAKLSQVAALALLSLNDTPPVTHPE